MEHDIKPRLRVNEKGEPIKKSDIKPKLPLFHLNDRNKVVQKQKIKENIEKGIEKEIEEEVITEEPITITCSCGHINNVY